MSRGKNMSFLSQQIQYDFQMPSCLEPMHKFYDDEMTEYKEYAFRKFSLYLDNSDIEDFSNCVAFSFCENIHYAVKIFQNLKLSAIHAYAIIGNEEWFREEIDLKLQARYEASYD
jgi:hypothetical protein